MKYITLITLIFISTYCFALDKKLIEGAEKYEAAVKNLEETESSLRSAYRSLEYWVKVLDKDKNDNHASDGIRILDQNHIDERNRQILKLTIQYKEAKEAVKKYEPIKNEYVKQVAIERKRDALKTAILNITGMLILPLCAFVLWLWFFIYICKRNKRLFKEGKLTQKEYDSMMQNHSTSMFSDDMRTNPATGLRMHGSVDAGGNPAGCPFRDSSMSSASQDYHDRHRWD